MHSLHCSCCLIYFLSIDHLHVIDVDDICGASKEWSAGRADSVAFNVAYHVFFPQTVCILSGALSRDDPSGIFLSWQHSAFSSDPFPIRLQSKLLQEIMGSPTIILGVYDKGCPDLACDRLPQSQRATTSFTKGRKEKNPPKSGVIHGKEGQKGKTECVLHAYAKATGRGMDQGGPIVYVSCDDSRHECLYSFAKHPKYVLVFNYLTGPHAIPFNQVHSRSKPFFASSRAPSKVLFPPMKPAA